MTSYLYGLLFMYGQQINGAHHECLRHHRIPLQHHNNGRTVRRAIVELSTAAGQWLGSFTVFGFNTQQLKDRAYTEADPT